MSVRVIDLGTDLSIGTLDVIPDLRNHGDGDTIELGGLTWRVQRANIEIRNEQVDGTLWVVRVYASDAPMRSVPLPTDPGAVVQVVVQVRHLPLLRALARTISHTVVGPFRMTDSHGDDDLPTLFLHPELSDGD